MSDRLQRLTEALTQIEGVTVRDSESLDNNRWWVDLTLSQDDQGWLALEWLAWAINHTLRGHEERDVLLLPTAAAPLLNPPGGLSLIIRGSDDPVAVADSLVRMLELTHAHVR